MSNLLKCGTCGRNFANDTFLMAHNKQHQAEQRMKEREIQAKLDAQWHADHPGSLMEAWNKLLNGICRLLGV